MATIDKERVNFLRGSKEDYESLIEKDNNTIYFILDTQEIYVGDKLFSTIDFNDLTNIPYIPTHEEMQDIFNALLEKQPKEEGKGLSTNDFTDEFKTKLISLFNYDDSNVKSSISNLNTALEQEVENCEALNTALAEETQAREALDAALGIETAARELLKTELDNEINNRTIAISNLNTALTQEVEARAALGATLNIETAARESLGADLINEINNRQIEDSKLSKALTQESETRATLGAALDAEVAARESLGRDLANEINNRQAEDSKLNTALGKEVEEREALEVALLEEIQSRETLNTALNVEVAARESLGANLTNEINNRQIADSNLNTNIGKISNKLFEQDEKFRGFITLIDEEQIRDYILSNESRKDWPDGEYMIAFLDDKIKAKEEEKFYQGIYYLTNNKVIQYIPDDYVTQEWVSENYASKADLANWRQYKVISNLSDVADPQSNIIYLVYNENYSSTDNVYDEYIWVTEKGVASYWEHLGSTAINIQNYQKKLTAGDNITIDENNTISANLHTSIEINAQSTDDTIPTSKAVKDYIDNLVNSALANVDATIAEINSMIGEVNNIE